jgi:uncharacterized protein YabN with tetrapyrrole methylase and pyrophosphatase domain
VRIWAKRASFNKVKWVMDEDTSLKKGSLHVVGTGIRTVGQLTGDTIARLKTADKVYYVIADIIAERLIKELSPTAESLNRFYKIGRSRREAYDAMVAWILESVRAGKKTCVAVYGHPGVFAFPTHESIRLARAEGYEATMFPAVSAEDCLFADLGIDPALHGCHSHEATRFVLHRKLVDPSSALILWQVGSFGDATYQPGGNGGRLISVLIDRLLQYYPADHIVTLYEAALFIGCAPRMEQVAIADLVKADLRPATTLYVPPAFVSTPDESLCERLGIDLRPFHQ